ncbi:MAG: TetR/AcrR family transcriptional regulator [Candidatus Delongbacteria bacterium]
MKPLTCRQEEIINASIAIISEKGIQNLTIKNISKRIRISEPAIYRHFESKIEILITVLSRFESYHFDERNFPDTGVLSPLKRIGAVFFFHFSFFEKNPAFASVVFSEEIFRDDKRLSEKIREIMKRNFDKIREIVEEGQKSREIRNDICSDQIILVILGSLRLLVKKWEMADHAFDIKKEGALLWETIEKIIK